MQADVMPTPGATADTTNVIVNLQHVTKVYERGQEVVPVLDGLDLSIREGSFEALMGPSGSGKSTLLYIIAGLDRPTGGTAHRSS